MNIFNEKLKDFIENYGIWLLLKNHGNIDVPIIPFLGTRTPSVVISQEMKMM